MTADIGCNNIEYLRDMTTHYVKRRRERPEKAMALH